MVAVVFAVLDFSDPRSGPVIEQAAGFLLNLGLTDGMSVWRETWDWLLLSNAAICPQEWSEDCLATVKFCFNRKHYKNNNH